MQPAEMIVMFTDFGLEGPYIGQLQAVLQQSAPGVPVVNLFADLVPFDIAAAAYLLPAYAGFFPTGTVFLCVVDPGVGGSRQGVVMLADGRWYVGPDEGLLALVARRSREVRTWVLQTPEDAAPSFHARDVFAPAVARLASGELPSGHGAGREGVLQPDWPDELWRIAYIDRYGNAITGLRADAVDKQSVFTVHNLQLPNARTFSAVPRGSAFWYRNANGLVEFAVNQGRADQLEGVEAGAEFHLLGAPPAGSAR